MKPLKRHPALIALSQEHHHALALCLRILRQPDANHRDDILAHQDDLLSHFAAEEMQFAPYWPHLPQEMVAHFQADHADLRAMLAQPDFDDAVWNIAFAERLREHARFEERELFPAIQTFLPAATTDEVLPSE